MPMRRREKKKKKVINDQGVSSAAGCVGRYVRADVVFVECVPLAVLRAHEVARQQRLAAGDGVEIGHRRVVVVAVPEEVRVSAPFRRHPSKRCGEGRVASR